MARKFKEVTLPDHLELRKLNATEWMLLQPYRAFWVEGEKEMRYTVEDGLITDLSSIPRFVRSIIPQIGKQDGPSIIHDAMYMRREPGWSRKEVDRFFLAAMKSADVKWIRRTSMYAAVRAFGRKQWLDDD